jgi:ATP-dependent DNA helicase RecQ
VDRDLFETQRRLRLDIAHELGKPPYVIFGDATLRELARVRPQSLERMRGVYGVGDAKLRDFGARFLAAITAHADTAATAPAAPATALDLYRQGRSIAEVMRRLNVGREEAVDALVDFIRRERPASLATWVDARVYQQVRAAIGVLGSNRPEPLGRFLGEQVSAEDVRLVLAHIQARS